MSVIGRRRLLLATFVVVFAAASVGAFVHGARTRDRLVNDAAQANEALVRAAVLPELRTEHVANPGARSEVLDAASQLVLADDAVESVTVWAPDGTILFAADAQLVGHQVHSIQTALARVRGPRATSDVRYGTIRTFVPYETGKGARMIVEADRSYEPVAALTGPWRRVGLATGVVAALAALGFVWTLVRDRRQALGFDPADLRSTAGTAAPELAIERARTQALMQEVDALRRQVEATDAVIAGANAERESAAERIRTLTQRAEAAEAEVDRARAPGSAAPDAPRAQLDAMAAELRAAQAELGTLRGKLESVTRARETLQAELTAAREEADAARADAVFVKGALAASTKDREALRSSRATHEATIAELTKEIQSLRGAAGARARAGEAEGKGDRAVDLEEELQAAIQRAERAETAFAEVERAISALPPDLLAKLGPRTEPTTFGRPNGHVEPAPPAPPGPTNGDGHRPEMPAPVEVDTLVRRLVQEKWSHGARVVSVYAEPASVEIGARDLESILDALLRRSLQHTPEDAQLGVRVERREDGVLLSVEDGEPASPDAISPEVARLTTLHGGRASVEPRPGGGAIVSVFLPRRAGQAASVRTE